MSEKEQGHEGDAKVFVENKRWDELVKGFSKEIGVKAIDFTPQTLRSLKVTEKNINPVMKSVVRIICEFYGIKLWELKSSGVDLVEKYGLSEQHFKVLSEFGDISVAYNNFVKQYVGDNSDGKSVYRDLSSIPTTQNVPNIDEKQIMKELQDRERHNLEILIMNEKDEKKKKLYAMQLETLNLKQDIENGGE